MDRQNKPKLLNRLNRIEGQVRGIVRMVEEDRYCIDVLTQLQAVRAAVSRVETEMLKGHLTHCIESAIVAGDADEQRRKAGELIELLERAPVRSVLFGGAAAVLLGFAATAAAQTPPATAHAGHQDHATPPATPPPPADPAGQDHAGRAQSIQPQAHGHAAHAAAMTGALGAYPMTREASGTAWQPDASAHMGRMRTRGDWTLMGHAVLNGVYDWQEGPRGDGKAFVSGMLMGMAQRSFANGDALQLRAMISPDPLMGRRGYPLLLASGETADGLVPLVDRQHPHDLVMELSASYSRRLGARTSVFLYGGLPGEPAFGPPAFMHRASIMDSPEAPIAHHWLDSTHITFGVLTAGLIAGDWKLEASRFRGREPDQHRFDIETGALDSTALRVSWNPAPEWSLQVSWADVTSPEQLAPDEDVRKWSASAIHTRRLGEAGLWSTTAAWGRRSSGHHDLDAWVLESAVKPNADWTMFARAERTENPELAGGHHGEAHKVAKISLGALREWPLAGGLKVGLGGLYAFNFIPKALEPAYGGDPNGAMAFVRLKIE